MTTDQISGDLRDRISRLDRRSEKYVVDLVELILDSAAKAGATDIHFQPGQDAVSVRWRIDGSLFDVCRLAGADAPSVVARLKVLADLLTYQYDVPQEGRIRRDGGPAMRVGVFPGIFGERVVVRIFAPADRLLQLDQLGFAADEADRLRRILRETSGLLLFTGPAGSGKTTTLYACLREICAASSRSIVAVEDPVEAILPGVVQAQIRPASGFDFPTALKSLMRQDPDVVVVGEIRDDVTARTALQAALTGHLALSTFHARSACSAAVRLLQMEVDPIALESCLLAIVAQRLLRRRCQCAKGCDRCDRSGYLGRFPLAEVLEVPELRWEGALLHRPTSRTLETLAIERGMVTLAQRAAGVAAQGITDLAEVERVLGRSTPG